MSDDFDDDEEEFDEQELEVGPYELYAADWTVVKAAIELLEKILCAPSITPAKFVSVSKVLYVLKQLPGRSSEIQVEISLTGPRQWFHSQGEAHEVYHWWTVEVERSGLISIRSAGHFYRRSTGGDTFISMQWSAFPGYETDYEDFLPQLSLVDDARPFDLEVTLIDLSTPGYSISVEDEDNPLLDEDIEEEEEEQEEEEQEEEEQEEEEQEEEEQEEEEQEEEEQEEEEQEEEEEEEQEEEQEVLVESVVESSKNKSTPELTANLWAFMDSGTNLIYALAGRAYYLCGNDSKKLTTLRELSRYDFQCADRVPVPERFQVKFDDGTIKSGVTTERAARVMDLQLFEEVFGELEKALPSLPGFLNGQTKKPTFPNDPLCARTIVFEDEAGNCRAIVTDEDEQWLAEQLES